MARAGTSPTDGDWEVSRLFSRRWFFLGSALAIRVEEPFDFSCGHPLAHPLTPNEIFLVELALIGELLQFDGRDRSTRLIVLGVKPLDLGHWGWIWLKESGKEWVRLKRARDTMVK